MSSTISNERRGRVRWVTLDDPGKGNALDRDAMVALTAPLEDVLTEEIRTVRRLVRTEDVKEGVASFLEKRKPVFRGR